MNEIHIDCPHCGSSFDAQIQGEPSNMMVFCCARCQTPLMYYHGEVAELDREEFAGLRKKLSRAIDAVVKNSGAESSLSQVAATLRKMVEVSDALANQRDSENDKELPQSPREGSAPSEFASAAAFAAEASNLSDETLANLQKELDELDVDSFLDKL